MNNKEIYKKLRETLTPEEIADAFVFPSERSKAEEKEWIEKMKVFIIERRKNMTWSVKMKIRYLSIKYRIQDWIYSKFK